MYCIYAHVYDLNEATRVRRTFSYVFSHIVKSILVIRSTRVHNIVDTALRTLLGVSISLILAFLKYHVHSVF